MVIIIILAFMVSLLSCFIYSHILEKRERDRLRLLAELKTERVEKLRLEKLRSLENERSELLVQRDLYNRLAELNPINEYTTNNEKELKKSIAIHKNIATIDKKITGINEKINKLQG